ncbi:MAG: phage portal protein [Proteobacteria bacterium]|nr:phage portal protein [Pseudomonadota bacterium]MCL2306772.1 phage portal protein [Pseudomonadota bacterium]
MSALKNLSHRVARRIGFVPVGAAKAAVFRAFAAAKVGRLTSRWETTDKSINDELKGDLDRLRLRSRDLFKNDEYARKFGRMVRNNVVGPAGIRIKQRIYNADGSPDTIAQTAIAEAWKRWGRRGVCEISGHHGFRDLLRGLIIDAARDGEFLLRKVRGEAARNDFGFALQRLDPARLDTRLNRDAASGLNAIIMGVEVDDYSRPVAYHILEAGASLHGERRRMRVPADEIIHGFVPDDFCEARRGTPWMYAAMLRLNDLKAYREAAIIAARIGASKMGFYVQREDHAVDPSEVSDGKDEEGRLIEEVEAGVFDLLPQGVVDFKTFDPAYPHDQFDPFTKAALRGIASGVSVSYVTLANDLEGVNFSSIRQGVLDERDEWMTVQDWFIEAALEEIYPEWLRFALLNGQVRAENGSALPLSKYEKFLPHECQGRRWAWVDPLKDAQAAILRLNNKLTSRTRISNEGGADLEDIFAEIENEEKLASEYGVDLSQPPVTKPNPSKDEKDDTED